ncbi:branched-chain amino acid ABC transporter permease [Acuticoccus sp.]|uniref:branched-chain amino acid ABC transporter permease n=1 Tax=Acuticoccus sp. TaxID=1904378 RepID=UPI003B527891
MATSTVPAATGGASASASAWLGPLKVVAAIALLIAAPYVLYPVFLAKVLCFALFASAFNLLLGFAGLLSFGHAAFFGFSAYVSAHAAKEWGLTPELAILSGTTVAALLGTGVGLLAIRRQGIYFAMVTLALAQMVFFLCVQAEFTRGEDGIQGVPRGDLFGLIDLDSNMAIYYFVLAIFVIGIAIIYRTVHSPFGQVLKSIRENEPRAISLGYDADRYKLIAFVLSATLSGLAGATKVLVFQLASLTDVAWQMSGEVVLMTILGGVGTMLGPIVGAAIIVTMQNYLAQIGSLTTIIQGFVFVFCVLLFRRGIVGEINHRWRQLRSRGREAPAALAPAGTAPRADGDAEAAHARQRTMTEG